MKGTSSTQSRRERRTVAILRSQGFDVVRTGARSPFQFVAMSQKSGDRFILVDAGGISAIQEARFRRLETRCGRVIFRWRRRLRKPEVVQV